MFNSLTPCLDRGKQIGKEGEKRFNIAQNFVMPIWKYIIFVNLSPFEIIILQKKSHNLIPSEVKLHEIRAWVEGGGKRPTLSIIWFITLLWKDRLKL